MKQVWIGLAFLLVGSAGAAEAACPALTEVADATNAGDENHAKEIAANGDKGGCSSDDVALIDRIAALATFNRVVAAVGAGASLAGFESELKGVIAETAAPWQLLDALGDINRDRKDYEAAARYYQSALEDSDNRVLTPDWMAPDAAYIARLDRLATEMRLAAPKPVKLAVRGACKVNFRGVSLKKKATPVRYVFGTADFTPEGLESAKDLSQCLKSVKPSSITLIGHTDPIGAAAANRTLSVARAEALAEYLVAEGYSGEWNVVGKGEDEPFKPDDASAYDEDTLNQLNRRVEVDLEQ